MIANSSILKIEGQNVNINDKEKQKLLFNEIASIILHAFQNYFSCHRLNMTDELFVKLNSLLQIKQESIYLEMCEIERVQFKINRYSEISIVNCLLQLIISSQFNCMTIEDLENIPYEFFTSSSISKIFEGIDYKTKKIIINETMMRRFSSYKKDNDILNSFFNYLKTTKIIESLEEIEINGCISYDFCLLSKEISQYKWILP